MKRFLVIDPGRDKTGLAMMDENGKIIHHEIIPSANLMDKLKAYVIDGALDYLVMGDGTSSKKKQAQIKAEIPTIDLVITDEYATTEEGRKIYFELNPPSGWRKLIPRGMMVPPGPIDDYAAIAIGRRYLQLKKTQKKDE